VVQTAAPFVVIQIVMQFKVPFGIGAIDDLPDTLVRRLGRNISHQFHSRPERAHEVDIHRGIEQQRRRLPAVAHRLAAL
jgi:hypothetical protein